MTGEQLQFLRQFTNTPKKRMAEIMGIIPRHLQYYENGKFKVSKKHDQLLKNGLFGKKRGQKSVENRKVMISKNTKNSTPRPVTSGLEPCFDCQKKMCPYFPYLDNLLTNYLDYLMPRVDKRVVRLIKALRSKDKGEIINVMRDIEERLIQIKAGRINKTGQYIFCKNRQQRIDKLLCSTCSYYEDNECTYKSRMDKLLDYKRRTA